MGGICLVQDWRLIDLSIVHVGNICGVSAPDCNLDSSTEALVVER
jgi:hypothetical protein